MPKAKRKLKRSANNITAEVVTDSPKRPRVSTGISTIERPKLKASRNDGGVILSFGCGDMGQLGLGEDVIEKLRPGLVPNLDDVVDICAGGIHSLCLTSDGSVYSWGCNDEGALAREGDEFVPGKVHLPVRAVQISAGDSHSAALLENGAVFAWGVFRDGSGSMGIIGNGNKKPTHILPDHFVVRICSGQDHLVMLTDKHSVYTVGCGQQGQLGRLSVRATSRDHRRGIVSSLVPDLVLFRSSKKMEFDNIWTATFGTFARDAKTGNVYVFGLNNYHQLGLKETDAFHRPVVSNAFDGHRWQKIDGGQHHALALDEDGVVYVIGRKEYGRLGLGKECSDAETLTPIPALRGKKCVDIACGETTSFAISKEGELYSWGMGNGGSLGSGEEDDLFEPELVKGKNLNGRKVLAVASGGQHTIVIASKIADQKTSQC